MSERIPIIDLRYQGVREAIASYIVRAPDGPLMIETGPGSTTAALARGLASIGLQPRDISHVFVTHIHLDHAGAAGWMAAHGAMIHVHEFGAPHLINPRKLLASARRIYRERMDTVWGEFRAVPADQIVPLHDGDVIDAAGLAVRAIATPGHARHHHAFALEVPRGGSAERICFTGDVAGTFVHEAPHYQPVPTPAPEFDLELWLASIARLEREGFDALYPTHFGRVPDSAHHLAGVRQALIEHTDFIRALRDRDISEEEIRSRYAQWFRAAAQRAGVPRAKLTFYVSRSLVDMNVTGILRYLNQSEERIPAAGRRR